MIYYIYFVIFMLDINIYYIYYIYYIYTDIYIYIYIYICIYKPMGAVGTFTTGNYLRPPATASFFFNSVDLSFLCKSSPTP